MRALGLDLQHSSPAVAAAIPSPIDALAKKRWAAKQSKDFATADALRKELTAAGWSMLDNKDSYKLEPVKKS
jgi:cysteinyl-tRNA synthetase